MRRQQHRTPACLVVLDMLHQPGGSPGPSRPPRDFERDARTGTFRLRGVHSGRRPVRPCRAKPHSTIARIDLCQSRSRPARDCLGVAIELDEKTDGDPPAPLRAPGRGLITPRRLADRGRRSEAGIEEPTKQPPLRGRRSGPTHRPSSCDVRRKAAGRLVLIEDRGAPVGDEDLSGSNITHDDHGKAPLMKLEKTKKSRRLVSKMSI